jgi:hypothetical protein
MNTQKTIKELSIAELKAVCYDSLVQIQKFQENIKVCEQELVLRAKEEESKEPVQKEETVK